MNKYRCYHFEMIFIKLIFLFSQAITYGICLNELGEKLVHKYEGREHSGRKFNEIALDHQSRKIYFMQLSKSVLLSQGYGIT